MLGSYTSLPGLGDDLNLEESTGRDPTSDPVRFFILSGRQQTANGEGTGHTSETVPQPTPAPTIDADVQILGTSWRKCTFGKDATAKF